MSWDHQQLTDTLNSEEEIEAQRNCDLPKVISKHPNQDVTRV
jgi:hypothetical protein